MALFYKCWFFFCIGTLVCVTGAQEGHEEKRLSQLAALTTETPPSLDQKKSCRIVRVLLAESKKDEDYWQLQSDDGFILSETTTSKKIGINNKVVVIQVKDGALYLNKRKCLHNTLLIKPKTGIFSCLDGQYQGFCMVVREKGKTFLINCLELEDYLFSVVRFESWPGWPLEVNKVFAVASRSYVIAMILRAKKNNRPYHIKSTNEHQRYGGFHKNSSLKDAIEQTRGIFLSYDNKPIVAMFDSCCGGIIPANIDGVNFVKAPYLARNYACHYCKSCKIYGWQVVYSSNDLVKKMAELVAADTGLKSVKIVCRDKAGLVQEVEIKGANWSKRVTGKQLYSLFKEIKSFHFSIHKKANNIFFKGRGYGHHLGLCQWGAREMVRDGWDYKRILQFYYPGTTFVRLSK